MQIFEQHDTKPKKKSEHNEAEEKVVRIVNERKIRYERLLDGAYFV